MFKISLLYLLRSSFVTSRYLEIVLERQIFGLLLKNGIKKLGCAAPGLDVFIRSTILISIPDCSIFIWSMLIKESDWTLWPVPIARRMINFSVISRNDSDSIGSNLAASFRIISEFHVVLYLGKDGLNL